MPFNFKRVSVLPLPATMIDWWLYTHIYNCINFIHSFSLLPSVCTRLVCVEIRTEKCRVWQCAYAGKQASVRAFVSYVYRPQVCVCVRKCEDKCEKQCDRKLINWHTDLLSLRIKKLHSGSSFTKEQRRIIERLTRIYTWIFRISLTTIAVVNNTKLNPDMVNITMCWTHWPRQHTCKIRILSSTIDREIFFIWYRWYSLNIFQLQAFNAQWSVILGPFN